MHFFRRRVYAFFPSAVSTATITSHCSSSAPLYGIASTTATATTTSLTTWTPESMQTRFTSSNIPLSSPRTSNEDCAPLSPNQHLEKILYSPDQPMPVQLPVSKQPWLKKILAPP